MIKKSNEVVVHSNTDGSYVLNFSRSDVSAIHFADIDLVVCTKDGKHHILPGVAIDAMEEAPPLVTFTDASITADILIGAIQAVDDKLMNAHIMGSSDDMTKETQKTADDKQAEVVAHQLQLAHDKIADQTATISDLHRAIEEQQKTVAEAEAKAHELVEAKQVIESQDQVFTEASASQHEKSLSQQMEEQLHKNIEQLHSKDYDYVAPRGFQAPPAPFAGPSGVPAPISMTPLVLLTMGNVVGTSTDTTTIPGTTIVYGGGGADGTDAASKLGPRDPLQFSAALINGTNGDDVVYAEGPLVGNADPASDTSLYAKQFLLRVAGYFTQLNDIVISGLPSYVSVTGATLQSDGSWVLPSSYVISQQSFELVYDKDAWRSSGSDTFDANVEVSGTARGTSFTSSESFRFQFLDVTDTSQVSNQFLSYWDDGQSKQIFVLQTQDQPNIIDTGDGNDIVYGGRGADTITLGDGNDAAYAYDGDNIVYGNDDNDTIVTGSGNDIVDGGADNDTIDVGDGNNIVTSVSGDNYITAGSGNDTITTGGGNDIIIVSGGNNIIDAGEGNNTITTGAGNDVIYASNSNNTVNAGDGTNQIVLGGGINIVTTGSGVDHITVGDGGNTIHSGDGADIISSGDGDDFLYGEGGNDTIHGGMGTNLIDGGSGSNTADYTGITESLSVDLTSYAVTAYGLSDTLVGVENIIGSDVDDIVIGNSNANILFGGAGNDTITGGGGSDTLRGDAGNDTLTGGTSADIIYGGDGADTIDGGGGSDDLYGDAGDDIFINPLATVAYHGGDGTDKIDYSAYTANLNINLAEGVGYADSSLIASYDSIEWIVGGSGSDILVGTSSNDVLDGGAGNDSLYGGQGSNHLIGGSGTNTYVMGAGADFIDAQATGSWDIVSYINSPVSVVVNLSISDQSFVNSLGQTVTIGALSGGNREETASDINAWSQGDTYNDKSINDITLSSYDDVIWGADTNDYLYGANGNDIIYGGGGGDRISFSRGYDQIDGGADSDFITTMRTGNNITLYLDGSVDLNTNGIADALERGIDLTLTGYAGFVTGWDSTYNIFKSIENVIGGSGSDFIVGDDGVNNINAQTGSNTIYALGGDDVIVAHHGTNTIDGGDGSDTVYYGNSGYTGSYGYESGSYVEIYLSDADLNGDGLLDVASTWGGYSGFTARTITSGGGSASYSQILNVENITGSLADDLIAGNSSANLIYGNSGNDIIAGNGGADTLYGEAGNDTFVMTSAQVSSASLIDGGSNTDTLRVSGWSVSSGELTSLGSILKNIETLDVRNSISGDAVSLTANDIRAIVDSGSTSVLQLNLDSGDTYSCDVSGGTGAVSYLNTLHTSTDDVFKYYSDAGQTTLVATLNIHYGA